MEKGRIKVSTRWIFIQMMMVMMFVGISYRVDAQIICDIQLEDGVTMPVCYGTEMSLSVEFQTDLKYKWIVNNVVIDSNSLIIINVVESDVTYNVEVTSETDTCTNSITIRMREPYQIDFEQTQLTCSDNQAENGRNAIVTATASGPYTAFTYEWLNVPFYTGTHNETAMGLSAWKDYYITVTNEYGCQQTDTVTPKAYPNPDIEIFSDPKDTVYIQKPYVVYSFENHSDTIEVTNFFWEFMNNPETQSYDTKTSTAAEPMYAYSQEGNFGVKLTVTNPQGCDTTFTSDIDVLPVKLKIPNIFTPNGDGINDYFIIAYDDSGETNTNNRGGNEYDTYVTLSEYYESSKLVIFNRWGRIVYQSNDYKNDWDGGNLPDATYFYVLECKGKKSDQRYQGSITIFGSGR